MPVETETTAKTQTSHLKTRRKEKNAELFAAQLSKKEKRKFEPIQS